MSFRNLPWTMWKMSVVALAAAMLTVVAERSAARSPYLSVPSEEGTILWSSEVDFTDGKGILRSHGDILVDLETWPGEGTAVLPGGRNDQLIAVFYSDDPVSPIQQIPQKGLDALDVVALTTDTLYIRMVENMAGLQTAAMPKVFFSTEAALTPADFPPLAMPWANQVPGWPPPPPGLAFQVNDGDILTNSGVVIPNYFLIEPFDFYIDPDGPGGPLPPMPLHEGTYYEWGAGANMINIGLDALDIEGITTQRFDQLTDLARMCAGEPFYAYGRLNELVPGMVMEGGLGFSFSVFFSFEETEHAMTDPMHYTTYPAQHFTLYLGPMHRIADPFTGARLPFFDPLLPIGPGNPPADSAVSDDDLLMVRFPYVAFRNPNPGTTWPASCDGAVVRCGRDNIPALGGGDTGCLFRDTNKIARPGPLGLDAVDMPAKYVVSSALPLFPSHSDEEGETGRVGISDALLGYSPFSMILFSTSASDSGARRTLDAAESLLICPGTGETPALFPFSRSGIDECDVLGSDSPPVYPLTNPPNPADGVFRGVELIERLMGTASGEALPPSLHAGLDALDVIPMYEPPVQPPPPEPPRLFWKEFEGHYLPDFDQKQNGWHPPLQPGRWTWCGPVAEANSLWWFRYRFPQLMDETTTPGGLITELAGLMHTDVPPPKTGTSVTDLYNGAKAYLINHAASSFLEVHWIPNLGTDERPRAPFYEEVSQEILKCQDVTLLLGFYRVIEVIPAPDPPGAWSVTWQRVGGHYVSCAGTSPTLQMIAFSDPYFDNHEDNLTTGVLRGTNHQHPTGHNDGISASHDIYKIFEPSISPGGMFQILDYPATLGNLYWFEELNGGSSTTTTLVLGPPPLVDQIFTEVEAAVAVSPILPPVITITPPGKITTTRGGPATTAKIATVTDDKDITVPVSVQGLPPGVLMTVSMAINGDVTAVTTATCASTPGTYNLTLTAGPDSDGGISTDTFQLEILPNPVPTIGIYPDVGVAPDSSTVVSPSSPPADGNDNIVSVTVDPTALPGGGNLLVDFLTGDVTIQTVAATQVGSYEVTVAVTDACGDAGISTFSLTVAAGTPPVLTMTTTTLTVVLTQPRTANVATVSDAEDTAGSLTVTVVSVAPSAPTLSITPTNTDGTVSLEISAPDTVAPDTYTVTLKVEDSTGLTAQDTLELVVVEAGGETETGVQGWWEFE